MSAPGGKRYLGIELGGSRRTAVVCLDYFAASRRAFVVEIHPHLHGTASETADEALLGAVSALAPDAIGVDAPLTLPPCLQCALPLCVGASHCENPQVKWMREEAARRGWSKAKFPPPYTHRPIDLLQRGRWQDAAPLAIPSEESFGSGRAPLAARMGYLRRHLRAVSLFEVSPRFTLAGIISWYGISKRELRLARDVEVGVANRFSILSRIGERPPHPGLPYLFLYVSDVAALSQDLNSFDAFLCALMVLYADLGLAALPEVDPAWGMVLKPKALPPALGAESRGEP